MSRLIDVPGDFLEWVVTQIRSNPTIVAGTVTQFVILGKVFGWFTMTEQQHDTLTSVVAGLAALWLRNQVVPNVFKEREIEKSVLHREATGTGIGSEVTMGTGTGTGARDRDSRGSGTADGRP